MPTYDGGRYSPPAAVATVIVLSRDSGSAVEGVSMSLNSVPTFLACRDQLLKRWRFQSAISPTR